MAKLGALKYNKDFFVSAEQCKRDETPVFVRDGVRFAVIAGERYRVKSTLTAEIGSQLIQYFKSGR